MINLSPAAAATLALSAAILSTPATANQGMQPQFGGQPAMGMQQAQQNPAVEQFRATLQQFGAFQAHPTYGEVWTPAPGLVPQGWRPYPECHWTYDQQSQAWFFNDQTQWGQIVHHHGRWAFDPQMGFMWIADANFGPGWVVWRADAQQVSWAAMTPDGQEPPREHWHTQDARTFNAGCRQSAPAPVASAPPAYAPPAYAPVYAQPQAPIVAVSRGPVWSPPIVVQRPPIIVTDGGGGFCHRFPLHPRCRQVLDPRPPFDRCNLRIFPRPPGCDTGTRPPNCHLRIFPRPPGCGGPVAQPGPRVICNGVVGPGNDPRCRLDRPTDRGNLNCRGVRLDPRCLTQRGNSPRDRFVQGALCRQNPFNPGCSNRQTLRPTLNRPSLARPFPTRPHFTRPNFNRPVMARPNFNRPAMSRPNFARPNFARPSFSRPAMARPTGMRMARR